MSLPADPPSSDDQPAAQHPPVPPPELASLRAIYDRRRRRIRLLLTGGAVVFAIVLGVALWLFIRFPLRAIREHRETVAARELEREIAKDISEGDDSAAGDTMRKRLAQIDRDREPGRWAMMAHQTAGAYVAAQRYDDARKILDDALPWATKSPALGPDAMETVRLEGTLASLDAEQGKDEAAEKLLRQVLEKSGRIFGADDARTLMSFNNLGWFLLERSRLDEAEPLLMRCVGGMEKTGRGNTASMASVLDSIAHLRDKQGRFDEAVELQRRAVAIARNRYTARGSYLKKFTDYLAELEQRAKAEPERQ